MALLTHCPSLLFLPSWWSQVGEAAAGQQAGGQLREQGLEDGGLLAREEDGEGPRGRRRGRRRWRGAEVDPLCLTARVNEDEMLPTTEVLGGA